jgi:basic membrane protein A
MFHKKIWLVVSLLVVISMILTACAPKAEPLPTEKPATQVPTVAAPTKVQFCIMYSSSITENGWDASSYQSFLTFAANPGVKIEVLPLKYTVGLYGDEAVAAFRSYAEGGCDIIWDMNGNQQTLVDLSKEYPNVMFVQVGSGWIDGGGKNLYQYMHRCYDGSYLMGVLAGLTTKGTVIGAVGGFPAEDTNGELNGFFEGAKSVKPELKQKVAFINSWYDPVAASEAALSQEAAGADRLFMSADSFDSCGPDKKTMCFGPYIDFSQLYPGAVMASFVATWEPSYTWATQEWVKAKTNDVWSGGPLSFENRMATGACKIVLGQGIEATLPADVLTKYKATYEGIMNGSIVPTLNKDEPVSDQ